MRKVISGLFISVDGVTEAPFKWQFDVFDEDMTEIMQAHIAAEDTILLGRVTYEEWVGYWPTATDEPYASHINNTPKFVVTSTLETVSWQNASLLKGDLADEIGKLKRQPGKNIGVAGSPTLVRSLLQKDLLDELKLIVHPVVAGSGKRLFTEESALKRLKLVNTRTTGKGVVILTYQPVKTE
jgi:dihydrofolate reductase